MENYLLPYFGSIDINNLEEDYDAELELHGIKITLDINFGKNSISIERMNLLKNFLDNISTFDEKNRKHIVANYDNKNVSTVKEFIEFHINELSEETSKFFKEFEDSEKELLNKLQLVRIGFYVDEEDETPVFSVFDYMFTETDPDTGDILTITDEIICANTDENGNFLKLTWES